MKILFLDQFTHWGGAQIGLRDVILEARQRGWEPFLMAPGQGPLAEFCASADIPFQALSGYSYSSGRKSLPDLVRYPFDAANAARHVRALAGRCGIDLVYVNGPRMLPAGAAAGCPMLFHAHSYLDRNYARTIAGMCLRYRPAKVIAVSHFAARAYAQRPTVVYNGVEDHGYLARPQTGRQARIGIIGRIAPEKGHLDFVRAAAKLRHKGAQFIVFGAALFSGPAYERSVREIGGRAEVEFRGWTSDVAAALRELDVLAAPSSPVEACPRVVLEALSAGVPVVAYPSGGIPEIITHNETGLLTRQSTADALAESIENILDDPALSERCSRQGRQEWANRFSSIRFRKEIGDLIACYGAGFEAPERGAANYGPNSEQVVSGAAAEKL